MFFFPVIIGYFAANQMLIQPMAAYMTMVKFSTGTFKK